MDAEGLAMQVRAARAGDVTLAPAPMPRSLIHDLRRDWQRWSAPERVCATALGGLIAVGLATAFMVNIHLP